MIYTINVYGKMWEVKVISSRYISNGTLAVIMETLNGEAFATITINLPESDSLNENFAFIDTNNVPWAVEFLTKYEIAKDTGVRSCSGYCTYPLFQFDMSKLTPIDM